MDTGSAAHHVERTTYCAASGERSNCRPSGRGLAERGDDVVDDFLDQDAIVTLAHHANHGLGPGRAHQEPAMAVEPLLAGIDRRLDVGIVERLAAAVAHILQDLRQRIKTAADLGHRTAQSLYDRE